MSSEYAPPQDLSQLPAWLAVLRQRYAQEPSCAEALLAQAWLGLEQLQALPPCAPGVELGLFAFDLTNEIRDGSRAETITSQTLAWCEAGAAPALLGAALTARARYLIGAQRIALALPLLERAEQLAQESQDPLDLANCAIARAAIALRRDELAEAIRHGEQVLALLKPIKPPTSWARIYATLACAHRDRGDQARRRQVLLEGIAINGEHGHWGEAANLVTGLIDMALEAGDLDAAEQALQQCQLMADRASTAPQSLAQVMMQLSRANCLAARGRSVEAAELIASTLALAEPLLGQPEQVRRLQQLADLQAIGPDPAQALQSSRRAHQLRMALLQSTQQRELTLLQEHLELDHAQQAREQSEQHALELDAKHQALQRALQQQRRLQAELVEHSKLASLGTLLAGVAHELNTPLGSALTSLSTAADQLRGMRAELAGSAVSRSRLLNALHTSLQGGALAQRNLQRAQALVASYPVVELGAAQEAQDCDLDTLIREAWERSITPGSPLQLELAADLRLPVLAQLLSEVLLQLFQNAERHAYGPGQPGRVRVQAGMAGAWVRLSVADEGRGIPTELLPRVFEPYVSTQFGQGRSGLGLFVAHAAVSQRLGGKLRARSLPGAGACFEIEWPAPAPLSPERRAQPLDLQQ
ncbi:ATP-binding protein [Paucibacter sp. APW11]|uniref:histidine kinase n=1 Tax=Roseateles aquae TaxID=3077235 RepID=A0ABU3PBN2_9BURK|nr:ATP-binding protein [Paucibacter sp. APW11]MDT8999969.1 ATP-binding protein [Paucibacter sp. APW11]